MPVKSETLHGNVPDRSRVALLLIDLINDLEFPGGEALARSALPVAQRVARLKAEAKAADIPIIYVNDNFGKWRSDFRSLVQHCLENEGQGKAIAELLRPEEDDYFVLKPKHSGFYATALELLLNHLGTRRLILTGIAGNNCVLFTANDAYMRDFRLFVPRDCVVSETEEDNAYALRQMETILKADTRAAEQLDLENSLPVNKTISTISFAY